MSIVTRPSVGASMLGGSIHVAAAPCAHAPARPARPWAAEEGTAGTVAVVGAGKMGLPLATQFATHGWDVIAVDINPAVVAAINAGHSHVEEEPGLADLVARVHAQGRLRATLDAAEAAAAADVVVLIVPVMLDAEHRPDYRYMDPAVASIAPGVHAGSTVIFETTLPIGDTRRRFAPALEAASGLVADRDFFVAFSPERLFSGAVLENLAAYPKLVGGIGPASTERAARFYASVLDAEVVAMSSSEAAEFSKLADTTYRDVNIALANEFARAADQHGIDVAGGHRRGEQPALLPHPPAGDRRRRPLHPGLPAPPAGSRARAGGHRDVAPGERRPGRPRGRRGRRGAGAGRRPGGRAGAGPRPDLSRRRQRARLLGRAAAHPGARRGRRRGRRVRPAALRRGGRAARCPPVALGRGRARSGPSSPRPPTARSPGSIRGGSRSCGPSMTAATASGPCRSRRAWRTWAWASRPPRAGSAAPRRAAACSHRPCASSASSAPARS